MPDRIRQYKSVFHKMSRQYGYMFRLLKQLFMPRKDFKAIIEGVHATLKKVVPKMVDHNTNEFMKNSLPKAIAKAIQSERKNIQDDIAAMVDDSLQKERANIRAKLSVQMKDDEQGQHADICIWLSLKIKFERPTPLVEPCRFDVVHTCDYEDHHYNDSHPKKESGAKIQKTSKHETFTTGESSSSQAMNESTPFLSGYQEQLENFDAWQDDQGIDDDETSDEEVSP
nr:hypothetical protein [Tanacetum cinerariifolium]